jgi:hypothetical protein
MTAEGADVTEKMMDYVIADLRWKAKSFKESGIVVVYNGHVVKSDNLISKDLKLALRAAVQPLENVPEIHKDYHPGSDNQVLDLVHPSLFPLLYGRSRILEDREIGLEDCINSIGEGTTIPVPDDKETEDQRQYLSYQYNNQPAYSKRFQWLPCNVKFEDGQAKLFHSFLSGLLTDVSQDCELHQQSSS